MTSVCRDGFDSYGSTTAFAYAWAGNTTSSSFPAGRFGGSALSMSNNGVVTKVFDSAVSSFTVHCGINVPGTATAVRPCLTFRSGSTFQVGLQVTTSGEIVAYRLTAQTTGTELGRSATSVISLTGYVTFVAEIVISDTVGRITVYVDGVQVLNLTSQDTRNGTPTTVDTIGIGTASGTGHTTIVDDLYVTDSATRLTVVPICETLFPDSDGATLNWVPSTGTSHFATVDEAAMSATDYNSASTVGDVDELGLGNLSSTPTSIEEVTVVGYLDKTDAVSRSVALGVKSGATTSDGSSYALQSGGKRHERSLLTDPNTSAAWSASGVNALQIRPKVTV